MPRKTFVAGDVLTAADMNLLSQDGYIDNTDLATTAGQPGGAWVSYTATWTNISNGTKTAKYMQLGKTVFFRALFVVTTSPGVSGNFTVTLPVTGTSTNLASQFCASFYDDSATRTYPAMIHAVSTTALTISAQQFPGLTDSYNATPSSSLPFTWTTDDRIEVSGFYEVA
jgi:hypothetical protein